jgi:hypothetical protein
VLVLVGFAVVVGFAGGETTGCPGPEDKAPPFTLAYPDHCSNEGRSGWISGIHTVSYNLGLIVRLIHLASFSSHKTHPGDPPTAKLPGSRDPS